MPALESHPWSSGFTWTDHAGPSSTLTPEQVAAFDRDGYVVLPDLVPPDLLAEATAAIDGFDAETEAFLATLDGGRLAIAEAGAITFSIHLAARSAVLRRLVSHPNLVGVVADLVGPDARLYWDQAVYKKPEKPRRFPWHQDNGYAFVEPQQYLTIWLALTDATVDNGCPQVVPGLHRRGTLRHHYVDPLGWECLTDPDGVVPAPVAAGGAVVFSSLTPHLTGPNVTGAVRKAYIVQYAPDGAERLEGDWTAGPPSGRTRCNDAVRQPLVLRGGEPGAWEPGA
ncbi:MAG TPA: phytanoyl-CoA dioxygenase family protein [Acidimicrobiales bacterium]|jgi:phytanoyl-CoA hydroxylase|nr:phytanoyl-CoA dioxygenase family protein [Acidimicrobiales bacterium]